MTHNDLMTLAQRLREYNHNPHHINPMSEAFHKLITDAAEALAALAAELAAIRAAGGEQVEVCDGKEQEAFEEFAKGQKMDMAVHPMHWLFLNKETYAARQGWKAAIGYCAAQHARIVAAMAAELELARGEISDLHTTMMAAAVEIQEQWSAHCDEEGYGPANLMHRLEHGIASQYGYTAETLVRTEARLEALRAELEAARKQEPTMFALMHAGDVMDWTQDPGVAEGWRDAGDDAYTAVALYALPPLAGKVSAPEWVPVSERLPEVGENVLVQFDTWGGTGMPQHTTATLHAIPRHAFDNPPIDMRWFVTVSSGHELKNVTHWMPIADLRALLATPSMEVKS